MSHPNYSHERLVRSLHQRITEQGITLIDVREQLATERAAHAKEMAYQDLAIKSLGQFIKEQGERHAEELRREKHVRETAEREAHQHAERTAELYIEREKLTEELRRVERERDALRDLLREARDQICECSECADLRSRIGHRT